MGGRGVDGVDGREVDGMGGRDVARPRNWAFTAGATHVTKVNKTAMAICAGFMR
jgi:hypothetical protein